MDKANAKTMDYVAERYEHLKLCHGARDPFVQGYADCMRVLEYERKKREVNNGTQNDHSRKD